MRRHRYTKPPPGRTIRWGHPYAHGLRLFVPMNEDDGVLCNDLAMVRNNATLVGGASWSGGVVNLDGTDGELTMRRVPNLGDWTVHIRCSPDDVTSIARTWLDQGDILIKQVNDGVVYGATDILEIDYTSTVASALTAGEIADIFITRAGDTITAFVYDSTGALTTDSFTATGTPKSDAINLVIGAPSRTDIVYPAVAFTNLTFEQMALITASDVLEIPRGSLSINSVIDAENWNGTQISFEAIIRPNYVPGNGAVHYVFDNQGTGISRDRVRCYIDSAGLLTFVIHDTDSTQHLVSHDVTDWTAGNEYYVVCVLDMNNDIMILYVDGIAEDSTPTAALSSDTIGALGTTTQIAQDIRNINQLNGGLKYRIWNRVITATEITAQWNSGDMVEFSIVGPDVIAIDRFTESNTGIVYHHSGKLVSSIVAGGTEATFVSAAGSDIIKDGDDLFVQGGDGFGKYFKADGDWGDLGGDGDDDAGGAVADIEKVGKSVEVSTGRYVLIDTINADIDPLVGSYSVWVKPTVSWETPTQIIVDARDGSGQNLISLRLQSGNLRLMYRGNNATRTTESSMSGVTGWHHIVATWDTGADEIKIYMDGYQVGSTVTGLTAFVGAPTISRIAVYGAAGGFPLTGLFGEVQIHKAVMTDSDSLWLATHPGAPIADIYANTSSAEVGGAGNDDIVLYHNYRNGNLTDLSEYGNNGTGSTTLLYDQQAHVSKNHLITDENGGIGGIVIIGTPVTVAKESDTDSDSLSLRVLSDAADEGTSVAVDATNGDKFFFTLREKVTNGSFKINVTNGGGDLETGITDAGWTQKDYIISATGNLAIRLLSEQAADDWNISKWDLQICVAGNMLVAGTHYTRVFNTDTSNVGAEWSGLGSDATEVKSGDLYIVNDTAPATVASRIRDFAGGNVDGIRIHDRALSQNDIEAIRRQRYAMIR